MFKTLPISRNGSPLVFISCRAFIVSVFEVCSACCACFLAVRASLIRVLSPIFISVILMSICSVGVLVAKCMYSFAICGIISHVSAWVIPSRWGMFIIQKPCS